MSREARFEDLEARLSHAEELCPLGTFAWSSARGGLEWSAGLYRLTGCDPRAGPPDASAALALVHPDDRGRARRAARALSASSGPVRERLRLVRRDGDERVVEVLAEARGEANGVPALVTGACLDVTELDEARARERPARELERAAFREAPLGIDMISIEPASFGRILQVNQAFAHVLERSEEELVGADILELTHPDDREPSRAELEALERGDQDAYSIEKRYLLPSGEPVWVVVHASLFQPLDDSRSIALGQVENITARKQAERLQQMQLRVAKAVSAARRVADAMPEVLRAVGESLAWCAGAALAVADDRATALADTTWEREDATRTAGLVRRLARRPVQVDDGALAAALRDRRPTSVEVERDPLLASFARRTETRSAVLVPVPLEAGPPLTVLAFFDTDRIRLDERTSDALTAVAAEVEQLAARERAEAQLAHQALHDPLTGLANRTLLMDRVEHALVRRERTGTGLCLLFIDLDDFKRVNDTLGHPAGDDVLRAVGQRLRWAVRPEDTVARFGGDEFVVLAEGVANRDGVGELATRLLKSLAAPFKLEEEIFLGASIGAALIGPREKVDIREAIRRADAGMYRAKVRGRGRWELAPTTHRPAGRTSVLGMERALRHALDAGKLNIAYQPIVSLGRGGVREVEALARWTDPDLGPISPEVFVSVAEGSELILTLGRYVIEHACREMGGWLANGAIPGLARVSVNLSARQVGQPELAEVVEASLSDCRLEAEHLALEVTETALINSELATDALAPLREMGVCILVDDFGTGYASLGRLRGFPLDGLKIDRSFVIEMTRRPGECKLVEAMLEIGRALELDVVAEGIERSDQLELLRQLGCEFGQGFLFSRPVPAAELPQVARSLERQR